MYYYVGEDAKRAATFLTELQEVGRMILDLENRMNKLTASLIVCYKQIMRVTVANTPEGKI